MNEIIDLYTEEIDVLDVQLYSYNDSLFSVSSFNQSQKVLAARVVRLLEQSPAFADFIKRLKPKEILEVNMSKTAKELYKKGEWVLMYSKKKGGLIPILCDKDGKFVEQVTLNAKKVSPELTSSLTSLSMQQQLGDILSQIQSLSGAIERVETGQKNDRIGLYYSARQKYVEAMSMENIELQSQALLNAAHTANDARFQLMQTVRTDVRQIVYDRQLKKESRDAISNSVRESLRYINEATGICVASFTALGETKPLLADLKSYQYFIEQTFLIESGNNGLTICEELQRNWNGGDNLWLEKPVQLNKSLKQLIYSKIESPILLNE